MTFSYEIKVFNHLKMIFKSIVGLRGYHLPSSKLTVENVQPDDGFLQSFRFFGNCFVNCLSSANGGFCVALLTVRLEVVNGKN